MEISLYLLTMYQKEIVVQSDFLKESWSSSAGHDGLPALGGAGPLIVSSCMLVARVVLVVAEQIGLHYWLVGHCGHKTHARNSSQEGGVMEGTVDFLKSPAHKIVFCTYALNFARLGGT